MTEIEWVSNSTIGLISLLVFITCVSKHDFPYNFYVTIIIIFFYIFLSTDILALRMQESRRYLVYV